MKKTVQKLEKFKSFVFYFSLFTFHFSLVSLVVAGGGGGEEAAHTPLWKDYLWKIINFGILFFILFKFGKKPLQSFLRQRTDLIEKKLKEAQEAKELAQKALEEVEERLKKKDKEVEEIISSARQLGEKERARLIEEGNKLREKILKQARVNIDYELKDAKAAIKAEAVEIAIELAEKRLKERLTKEEQERLLEESITSLLSKK